MGNSPDNEFSNILGIDPKPKKSEPYLTQDLVYIVARLRTDIGRVFLPQNRLKVLVGVALPFLTVGHYRSPHQFHSPIGLMTSCISLVQYSQLTMRPI